MFMEGVLNYHETVSTRTLPVHNSISNPSAGGYLDSGVGSPKATIHSSLGKLGDAGQIIFTFLGGALSRENLICGDKG